MKANKNPWNIGKQHTGSEGIYLHRCEATHGVETTLTWSTFERLCFVNQDEEDGPLYCRLDCRGYVLPEGLTLIDAWDVQQCSTKNYGGSYMAKIQKANKETKAQRSTGKCDCCDQIKNVRNVCGREICANCEFIVRAAKNTPQALVDELKHLYSDQQLLDLFDISLPVAVDEPAADIDNKIFKLEIENKNLDIERLKTEIVNIGSVLGVDPGGDVLLGASSVMQSLESSLQYKESDIDLQEENSELAAEILQIGEILQAEPAGEVISTAISRIETLQKLQNKADIRIKEVVDNKNKDIEELEKVISDLMEIHEKSADRPENEKSAYSSLTRVLNLAYDQAATGKGKERHAKNGEPFERQKICEITRRVGLGYPAGQAIKKAEEALGLPPDAGLREILGAINYLAAGYIVMEESCQP